jgi:hypothetical protein
MGELAVQVRCRDLGEESGGNGAAVGAVRSKVCVASIANSTVCPRLPPTRAVVSQQWFVVIPQTTIPASRRARSQASRSGEPWKLELTDLATTRSGTAVR